MQKKLYVIAGLCLGVGALAGAQLGQILKVGGAVAAVKVFGKQMNDGINKLIKHKDTAASKTKVVVILSVTVTGGSNAIGAAQIMGPADKIEQVVAVAEPTANLFGKEVILRGLIPVASKDFSSGFKTVDGVGISGLVDMRL